MPVYLGTRPKWVLAFDIGTVYSSISYCVLDPGEIPDIRDVEWCPKRRGFAGYSKIPTVMYYDEYGKVCAAGAQVTRDRVDYEACEKGWHKAEWFKMHMRANNSMERHDRPPLPPNKTIVDVMGDYMRYLNRCAQEYIRKMDGAALWQSLLNNVDFILLHPNGWEGAQQAQMRRAAISGGLVRNKKDAPAYIRFVTEGEANLHFRVRDGLFEQLGDGVLIVDAGGGTIDLSAYSRESNSQFEEIAPTQSHAMGSIFVTLNAHTFLRELLQESMYLGDVDYISKCFDNAKLGFRDADEPTFIKFGTPRDRDFLNVDVASFFEPSVQCVIQAIADMRRMALKPISHVFLVGGFGENCITRNRAVADGAISFYIDHFVSVRVSKRIYGIYRNKKNDPSDAEHVQRKSEKFFDLASTARLPRCIDVILFKNERVSEMLEFRESYVRYFKKLPTQLKHVISTDILQVCYQRYIPGPRWHNGDSDIFSAKIPNACVVDHPGAWKRYYSLSYDVILAFGSTELQAQVAWKENGKEKRGPARIKYDNI